MCDASSTRPSTSRWGWSDGAPLAFLADGCGLAVRPIGRACAHAMYSRRMPGRLGLPTWPSVRVRASPLLEAVTETANEIRRIDAALGPDAVVHAIGLMFADGLQLQFSDDGWGAPSLEDLDVVRRARLAGASILDVFPHLYLRPEPGSEQDVDGFVATGTAFGVQLGTTIPEFFSHEDVWEITAPDGSVEAMRGSWYRIYFSDEEWDFANHSSIRSSQDAGQWLRREILNLAGPYVGEGGVSAWRQE